ncbi:MAG: YceI family protein [Streptosporangiaceae bacterium]|jgi:polyisoprenoid-binding protein YceI
MARLRPAHWARWLAGGVVLLAVLIVGGTYLYIHVIEGPAPAPLGLSSSAGASRSATAGSTGTAAAGSTATTAGSAAVAGTWKVGSGSLVGYRVQEVLFGQNNTAVGRTSSVTGSMTIQGATVTAGSFTVQMATIVSDQSQRDVQFRGRIMDTSAYPTGTLRLTRPISLAPLPAIGQARSYPAAGDLTLHGHSRAVTFTVTAERTHSGIEVTGSIPILFADWDIPNPSFGSVITTQNHGILEFLLRFSQG